MAKLLSIKDIRGPGRPPAIVLEMIPEIEHLASLGLSDATIAASLGVDPTTLRASKNEVENSPVLLALQKGRLTAIRTVAERIDKHAIKNPIVAIYQAKAVLGRHDPAWQDQKQVQHSGNVSVTVVEGIAGPHSSQPVIEAEYEDLGQSKSPTQDSGAQHADPTSDVGESGR